MKDWEWEKISWWRSWWMEEEEEDEEAPPLAWGLWLVRVSSLSVRNAVLHDLTAVVDEEDAIRYQIDQTIPLSTSTTTTTNPWFWWWPCVVVSLIYLLPCGYGAAMRDTHMFCCKPKSPLVTPLSINSSKTSNIPLSVSYSNSIQ